MGGGGRRQRCLSCIFCKASSYKVSSHFLISPHHFTSKINIPILETNGYFHAFRNLKFLTEVVLSYKFLEMAGSGVLSPHLILQRGGGGGMGS